MLHKYARSAQPKIHCKVVVLRSQRGINPIERLDDVKTKGIYFESNCVHNEIVKQIQNVHLTTEET